jgi:hypothetical protein
VEQDNGEIEYYDYSGKIRMDIYYDYIGEPKERKDFDKIYYIETAEEIG